MFSNRLTFVSLTTCALLACSSASSSNQAGSGDAGSPGVDSSTGSTDSGSGIDSTTVADSGGDSGTGGGDSSIPIFDSGSGAADSGVAIVDSEAPSTDSGIAMVDSGTPSTDSGTMESGTGGDAAVVHLPVPTSTCAPAKVSLSAAKSSPLTTSSTKFLQNIAAADMDGDGKTDLVVLSQQGVEVLISNGDGTFKTGKVYPDAAGDGNGFAVGSFTGTGYNDVALSSFDNAMTDSYLDVLPNMGNGTLGSAISSETDWQNVAQMWGGNLNGDRYQDVLFTAQSGFGSLVNNGGAKFGQPLSSPAVSLGSAVGNLGGKGVDDVLIVDPTKGACVALNNGSGQFAAPVCYASMGSNFDQGAIGDINGDKKNDLITLCSQCDPGNNLNVNLNMGSGVFAPSLPASTTGFADSSGIASADFNNDGNADIVVYITFNSGLAQVLLSNGDGTFGATPAQYAIGEASSNASETIVVGDFAGNGLRGMATLLRSTNSVDVITATCQP